MPIVMASTKKDTLTSNAFYEYGGSSLFIQPDCLLPRSCLRGSLPTLPFYLLPLSPLISNHCPLFLFDCRTQLSMIINDWEETQAVAKRQESLS